MLAHLQALPPIGTVARVSSHDALGDAHDLARRSTALGVAAEAPSGLDPPRCIVLVSPVPVVGGSGADMWGVTSLGGDDGRWWPARGGTPSVSSCTPSAYRPHRAVRCASSSSSQQLMHQLEHELPSPLYERPAQHSFSARDLLEFMTQAKARAVSGPPP